MYIKQLYSRYVYISFREIRLVSTEAQLILNKFQVHILWRIQINALEKRENKAQNRNQGPVVQSVVSLTSSLRVISLTVLADLIYNILIFFAEKM